MPWDFGCRLRHKLTRRWHQPPRKFPRPACRPQIGDGEAIFDACSTILQKSTDGLFEYETDGLIFTPASLGVGFDKPGEQAKNFKGILYSPDTCLFLPKDINVLVSKVEYHSATKEGGKYRAKVDFNGKGVELGRFSDKNNALWIKRVAKIGFIEQRLRESELAYLVEHLNYEL